ncbi:MAG: gamma-glutamyl-gamma-aminobutyrate hydrolase family protein [Desulfobacterales bacterium]|jgi:putative glutamine amidotransferase|nr:gamma-glutamyl-gamma-aminobutyrate hydrolase family protein [Desulfobacterales bacterium]
MGIVKRGRPLIGITCSRVTGGAWGVYSLGHFMDYTFSEYSQAILHADGAPLIVPAAQDESSLERILGAVQGLILSGGPDIHPRRYGEEPAAGLGEVDEALDRMELMAAALAVKMDLPVLGICRGIQVLNVALGGTLYQDIPSQIADSICHTPKADKAVPTHTVRIEARSRLRRIFGQPEIWVNGKHHQALKDPAPGLVVAARARDGVVEAVEHPGRRYLLGVQWHPEGTWRDDAYSKKLFRSFVRAAGEVV